MTDETNDFVCELAAFVREQLAQGGEAADYNPDAIEIIDARNALFRNVGPRATDEAQNIYALRDLCRVDEATMEVVPDVGRLAAVARNFF